MAGNKDAHNGRQSNQKMKPYLVFQYLMRQSDENHVVHAHEIVTYLETDCGITAERRSIYRDIEEINKALLILEEQCTMQEAEEMLADLEASTGQPVYIKVEPFKSFYKAEEFHQDYYLKHPEEFRRELIDSGRIKA